MGGLDLRAGAVAALRDWALVSRDQAPPVMTETTSSTQPFAIQTLDPPVLERFKNFMGHGDPSHTGIGEVLATL